MIEVKQADNKIKKECHSLGKLFCCQNITKEDFEKIILDIQSHTKKELETHHIQTIVGHTCITCQTNNKSASLTTFHFGYTHPNLPWAPSSNDSIYLCVHLTPNNVGTQVQMQYKKHS